MIYYLPPLIFAGIIGLLSLVPFPTLNGKRPARSWLWLLLCLGIALAVSLLTKPLLLLGLNALGGDEALIIADEYSESAWGLFSVLAGLLLVVLFFYKLFAPREYKKSSRSRKLRIIYGLLACGLILFFIQLQFAFLYITPDDITYLSTFGSRQTTVPWSAVEKIEIGFETKTYTNTSGRVIRESTYGDGKFIIPLGPDKAVDLWDSTGVFGLGRTPLNRLEQVTRFARDRNVPFETTDFYDRQTFEELSSGRKIDYNYRAYEILENLAITSPGAEQGPPVYTYKEITYEITGLEKGPTELPSQLDLPLTPDNSDFFTMLSLKLTNQSTGDYTLIISGLNNAYVEGPGGEQIILNHWYAEDVDFDLAAGEEQERVIPFDLPEDLTGYSLKISPRLLEDKILSFPLEKYTLKQE